MTGHGQLEANEIHYSSLITGCDVAGAWPVALHLLHSMGSEGIRADVVLAGAVLSACEPEGSWREAFEILDCASEGRSNRLRALHLYNIYIYYIHPREP